MKAIVLVNSKVFTAFILLAVLFVFPAVMVDEAMGQAIIAVDCTAGDRLTDALNLAQSGDIVRVQGTCTETVRITSDRVTIDGQGSAILDGGGMGQPVIALDGVRGARIMGLTVQNGSDGIFAQNSTSLALEGVTVADNSGDGLELRANSTARLMDCTLQRNGDNGLELFFNSSAGVSGSFASAASGRFGLLIANGSALGAVQAAMNVTDNGSTGILISGVSVMSIESESAVNVDRNGTDGLAISGSSRLSLSSGTITANENGRDGIFLTGSSNFVGFAPLTASSNGGDGVFVARTSSLEIGGSGSVTSEGNGNNGLQILSTSDGIAFSNTTLTIRNNSNQDIAVGPNSTWSALGTVVTSERGAETGATRSQSTAASRPAPNAASGE